MIPLMLLNKYPDAWDHLAEIKEIWETYTGEMTDAEIFRTYIFPQFFPKETRFQNAYIWFNKRRIADFVPYNTRSPQKDKIVPFGDRKKYDNVTDDEADRLQADNRHRAIFLLNKLLKSYEDKKVDDVQLKEVISLFDKIQAAEEAAEKLKLLKNKEKRENAIAYFSLAAQYGELKDDEIKSLVGLILGREENDRLPVEEQIQVG